MEYGFQRFRYIFLFTLFNLLTSKSIFTGSRFWSEAISYDRWTIQYGKNFIYKVRRIINIRSTLTKQNCCVLLTLDLCLISSRFHFLATSSGRKRIWTFDYTCPQNFMISFLIRWHNNFRGLFLKFDWLVH